MLIPVGPGPEDFVLDRKGPSGPRLLLSALDRRSKNAEGRIVRLDLGASRGEPMVLKGRSGPFLPLGISLLERDGESLLYVTNRPKQGPKAIEVFRVRAGELELDHAIPLSESSTPNDVLALSDGSVFMTNDGYSPLRRGSLMRFSGGAWQQLGEKIALANGLATDGKSLFVSHFMAKKIVVYDLETAKREANPAPSYAIEVDGRPDNLSVEADGRTLDAALHPSFLRTMAHTRFARFHAPSAYVRIPIPETPPAGGVLRAPKRVDVRDYNAASTALVIGDAVYLSQVADDHVLVLGP